ncbi:keratin, type I cytoskeletal 9 [Cocos nucifera]|nr:keratin, type I cytoskeletal 9 [Cocos nucifera]
MGNRWRKLALLLLLVLFLLQTVRSIGTNDSAFMQERSIENKTTTNRRSSVGRSPGEHGGSSGDGGDGASGGTSNTPNPVTGGGLAAPRNGAAAGHRRHNAASSTYSCSLPIVLTSTALGASFLAL